MFVPVYLCAHTCEYGKQVVEVERDNDVQHVQTIHCICMMYGAELNFHSIDLSTLTYLLGHNQQRAHPVLLPPLCHHTTFRAQ